MTNLTTTCHCGAMRAEFPAEKAAKAISCNCSICRRKGSVLVFVPAAEAKTTANQANIGDYQFGKKRIHHLFCKNCGVSPWSESSDQNGAKMMAINLRCVDGLDLTKIPTTEYDGASL